MIEKNNLYNSTYLMQVKDLTISYAQLRNTKRAVNRVTFELKYGEILGIIGESGAGKSTIGLAILGMIKKPNEITGQILVEGEDVTKMTPNELEAYRWTKVSMVFQTAMNSLNPVATVGTSFIRLLLDKRLAKSVTEARQLAVKFLRIVNLPLPGVVLTMYPHEMSGGMKQRLALAMAISALPKILIADEPTTALDTINQLVILELIKEIKEQKKVESVILISHDLAVHAFLDDRVLVMYKGSIVERGTRKDVFSLDAPHHPYTSNLINSSVLDSTDRNVITKEIPDARKTDNGCPFSDLCPEAMEKCFTNEPQEVPISDTHSIKCFLYG